MKTPCPCNFQVNHQDIIADGVPQGLPSEGSEASPSLSALGIGIASSPREEGVLLPIGIGAGSISAPSTKSMDELLEEKRGRGGRWAATPFDASEERGGLFQVVVVDPLALRLLKGHCVYSQSWRSDLWLHMKNRQMYLSLFLAHPKHPYSRCNRVCQTTVSWILAWGFEFWWCYWTRPYICPGTSKSMIWMFLHVFIYKILACAVGNGVYDAILELAFTCACVQDGCPRIIKCWCECLSFVQFGLQFAVAFIVLMWGFHTLSKTAASFLEMSLYSAITIRELLIGKLLGGNAVCTLLELIFFCVGRRQQMKPFKCETMRRFAWDQPRPGRCRCCPQRAPPNRLWNRFIGEEAEFADLPNLAPCYDVDVVCCGHTFYSERAREVAHCVPVKDKE